MKIAHPIEKIRIHNGEIVEAVAPVILSVSRSTDIPSFYAKWFMSRLREGYTVWKNPFNQKKSYISFSNTRVIVFWSKNPLPLLPFLDELDQLNINYYFQFTLNDYVKEKIEPGVPNLANRIDTFNKLSDRVGKDRVIWRFDPIIMLPNLNPREILLRIWNLSKKIQGKTSKLVFSFADINVYGKVQRNLIREGFCNEQNVYSLEPSFEQMEEFAEGLSKIREAWSEKDWNFELATCAEQIALEKYGINHNRCIDPELIKNIFSHDDFLMHYLKYGKLLKEKIPKQTDLFSDFASDNAHNYLSFSQLKDSGQRKDCGCAISKDIGFYNTCPHGCIYCYANTSCKSARNNYEYIKRNMFTDCIKFEKKV